MCKLRTALVVDMVADADEDAAVAGDMVEVADGTELRVGSLRL